MCDAKSDPTTYGSPRPLTYSVEYAVPAEARLEAITEATAMLRTGVTLVEVVRAERGVAPGYWNVKMAVREAA